METGDRENEIKEFVRKRYGELAVKSTGAGRSSCCSPQYPGPKGVGYPDTDLQALPAEAVSAGAGCGNPTAIAEIQEGDRVLDLGSGGGIDVFLAAEKVGASGHVIGVDMTPEMVELARSNAGKLAAANVEFRLGEIENLPVESGTIDVILSNCVINLSPEKEKVFAEAFRVLKPGGKIIISDVVSRQELPPQVRDSLAEWARCAGGVIPEDRYLNLMERAGFSPIEVLSRTPFEGLWSALIRATKPAGQDLAPTLSKENSCCSCG
ncbi:MAG: arsenite methyltransferase [Candidatus Tectomicrobia bacterium]|uniref:Arsenite methyltransferase n=1 Tax=Tectimicrobiota bacterium TaxID=2528274 RepID=A0A932M091_UNCTE|nr:arsenite methyltransferase [Candidatus Tectomicrobia bacterium]